MQKKRIIQALFLSTIILCFFIWTGDYLLYQYQFPPGDDPILHLNSIDEIVSNGKIKTNYPAIFHILLALLKLISGAAIMPLMIYLILGILGILLPGILIMILRKIPPKIIFIPVLLGSVPILAETYSHGQWPEIMAGFLGIFLAYLILKEKKLLSLVIGLVVLFTHHLTAIAVLGALLITWFYWLKRKKIIILIFVIITGFLVLIPAYLKFIYNYFKKFLIFDRSYILPLKNLSELWRMDILFYFILITGILGGLYFYWKNDRQKIFYLFIASWFLLLMFFSRFSYGDDFMSYRLMRNALWPGLLILPLGWLIIIKKINGGKKIFVNFSLILINVIFLINALYLEYPAQAYNRVTAEEAEILEYLKQDNAAQAKILMPGKNSLWQNYLSGQEFITTARGLAEQSEKDLLYWQILEGQINDPTIIKEQNIGYIYQIGPLNFYEVPYEAYWFAESKILATGLWELIKENDRARLFKLRE